MPSSVADMYRRQPVGLTQVKTNLLMARVVHAATCVFGHRPKVIEAGLHNVLTSEAEARLATC